MNSLGSIKDIQSVPVPQSERPLKTFYRSTRRIIMTAVTPSFAIKSGMSSGFTVKNEVSSKEFKNRGLIRVGKFHRSELIEIRESRPWVSLMPVEVRTKITRLERPAGWYGEDSEGITSQACKAAIEFADRAMGSIPGLKVPRVGPSLSGAVGLQWDLGDWSLVVRVPSADPSRLHFQEEGPGFHQEEGEAAPGEVLARLAAIRRKARQS